MPNVIAFGTPVPQQKIENIMPKRNDSGQAAFRFKMLKHPTVRASFPSLSASSEDFGFRYDLKKNEAQIKILFSLLCVIKNIITNHKKIFPHTQF